MSKETITTKIYTVEVLPFVKVNTWYQNKSHQRYDCVLVAKELTAGTATVQFLVVTPRGDSFSIPILCRTIRPEHCRIISERVVEADKTKRQFIRRFIRKETAAA